MKISFEDDDGLWCVHTEGLAFISYFAHEEDAEFAKAAFEKNPPPSLVRANKNEAHWNQFQPGAMSLTGVAKWIDVDHQINESRWKQVQQGATPKSEDWLQLLFSDGCVTFGAIMDAAIKAEHDAVIKDPLSSAMQINGHQYGPVTPQGIVTPPPVVCAANADLGITSELVQKLFQDALDWYTKQAEYDCEPPLIVKDAK